MKDTKNQLVDCKTGRMMLVTHMSETALLENHRLMAGVPGYMRAVAPLTHKTVVTQNYMRRELGCSWEPLRTHMRVMALLIQNVKEFK